MDRSPFRMCYCQTSRTVVDNVHGEMESTLTSHQQQAAVLQGVKKHVIIRQWMDEAARARDSVLALLEAIMEADEDTKVLLQEAANASQDHTDLLQAINASLLQLVQVGLYSIIPNLVAIASMDRSPFRMCSCQTSQTVFDNVHRVTT